MHADALFYLNYGNSIEQVNSALAQVLQGADAEQWDQLLAYSGERLMFDERSPGGVMHASQMLAHFGGKQIIHGHTPITHLTGMPVERVTRAYVYANGLAVDVDGGIYKGGAGFVYQAPLLESSGAFAAPSRETK
jgi:hypothetical protein